MLWDLYAIDVAFPLEGIERSRFPYENACQNQILQRNLTFKCSPKISHFAVEFRCVKIVMINIRRHNSLWIVIASFVHSHTYDRHMTLLNYEIAENGRMDMFVRV